MYVISHFKRILLRFCIVYQIVFAIIAHGSSLPIESSGVRHARKSHLITSRQSSYQLKCAADKFDCKCGRCLNKNLVCNGISECCDSLDESIQTCRNHVCPADKFRCDYGGCIDKRKLCNGEEDCNDGSDERSTSCEENVCSSDQFRCNYGGCISKSRACDGNIDCLDRSDETEQACHQRQCGDDKFRCTYGACINRSLMCDGFNDCMDRSDEDPKVCSNRGSLNSCILPSATSDKYYAVDCGASKTKCENTPGSEAPEFSQITFLCNVRYSREDDSEFISICKNGRWVPPINSCSRICDSLNPDGVDISCFRYLRGPKIACNKTLLAGSVVEPKCKSQYRSASPPNYKYTTCDSNGKWNNDLFRCSPECGKSFGRRTNLIKDGEPDLAGDSPWNVAVYDMENPKRPELICGGTIISSSLVVSAAHCFFDEGQQKRGFAFNYEIAVGKITRNYKNLDRPETKFYKIQKIFFPDIDFVGDATNYAADVAILWTTEKITFNYAVLPACVEWTHFGRFNPGQNVYGKLAGWGKDAHGNPSEILLAALLPYVSYSDCRKLVSEDFKNSISPDKFCAGTRKGAGARQGDSGAGLLFRDHDLYFVRGIVSNKDGVVGPDESSVATFTDIAQHIEWFVEVFNHVEKRQLESGTSLKLKT